MGNRDISIKEPDMLTLVNEKLEQVFADIKNVTERITQAEDTIEQSEIELVQLNAKKAELETLKESLDG